MRPIKFRGKRITDGEWVHGDLVTATDGNLSVKRMYIHNRISGVDFSENSMTSKICLHEIDLETVGQYTGLKDKNGKEIYEGDIVKQTYHTEKRDEYGDHEWISFDGHHVGAVVITARGVCLKNPLHYSMETDETRPMNAYKQVAGYRSDVIGNIYDNPELLEETK